MTDDFVSLVVTNAKRSDAGPYKVTLRNPAGAETVTFNVRVLDRPGPPERLRAEDFQGESLTLVWHPPADNGGAGVSNYVVEKREVNQKEWSKASPVTMNNNYLSNSHLIYLLACD